MKALLLHPEFPATFWSFKHALSFIGKKAAYPPLGLLTMAAMLPAEWEKRLADLNAGSLKESDLIWADIAFISGMFVQRESAAALISRCKNAGVKVVAGGPLFTSEYKRFPDVDHFVLNEAEITLPRFLADLEAGCPGRFYKTEKFADMTSTPPPLWELVDMKRYAAMSVQFSRGCPYDCDFCNVTALFGKRTRIKRAEQIVRELDILYSLGWRGQVFFVDDNFIGNRRYLTGSLLPELIQWRKGKKGVPFNTEASINLADDAHLMSMMVDAGFDAVFIGIETPDEGSLAECNKKQNTNRDLLESVRCIQRAGLQVQGGFIVGFDNDTPSIFQRQIEFIQKSGIVTAMVGLLQAPPGTRLYERLKRECRLLGPMSGNNDGSTNIVPLMGLSTLREGYRTITSSIYSPGNYYRRIKIFLSEYQSPKAKISIGIERIFAFLRSGFRLGILGRERFQYWDLLLWTLLHRPNHFSIAVTLAIYGHHFRRVSEAGR
jgi:radical SAM superfamily enzyme YgiQ (UPF0313 family)